MQVPAVSACPCGSIVSFGWTVVSGGHLLSTRDLYGRVGAGWVGSDQHAVEAGVYGKCFPRRIVGRELDLRRIGRQECFVQDGRIIVDDVDLILLHDLAGIVVDEQDLCLSCLAGFYMEVPSISACPCGSIVSFGWTEVSGGHLLAADDLYGRVGAGWVGSDQHAVEVGVHGKCFPRWIIGRELDLRRIGRQPCLELDGLFLFAIRIGRHLTDIATGTDQATIDEAFSIAPSRGLTRQSVKSLIFARSRVKVRYRDIETNDLAIE